MLILLLDPYHLGDPLFLTGFARDVQARGTGLVLVHGSAERGGRALEALGLDPASDRGVWEVPTAEWQEAVERAARDLNREIAHELNEAGVASIRVMGADRGLLRPGEDGAVEAGRAGWVRDLVTQGVVVVVAALVEGTGRALREVDAAEAAAALARRLGAEVGVLASPAGAGGASGGPPGGELERLRNQGVAAEVVDRATLRGGLAAGPGAPRR